MSEIGDALDKAILDDKLNSIDIDFTVESIKTQLDSLLENNDKTNYLKKFDKRFDRLNTDDSSLLAERDNLYDQIINLIADKFNIEIYKEDIKLHKLAKHMYKFFVLDMVDNITSFLEMYILDHRDSIIHSLKKEDNLVNKPIEGLDNDIALILNNISESIAIIDDSGITFDDFLEILNTHPDAPGSVSEIMKYNGMVIREEGLDLFYTIMVPIINEDEGFSYVYTNLQMNICKRFSLDEEDEQEED